MGIMEAAPPIPRSALGDEDGVIRAYHACERAVAAIGTGPSPTTRDLLERLRR